jgi:hypothetical protein
VKTLDGFVRIEYDATIRPDFVLPPVIGARLLKRQLAQSLQAIVERVEAASRTTVVTTP